MSVFGTQWCPQKSMKYWRKLWEEQCSTLYISLSFSMWGCRATGESMISKSLIFNSNLSVSASKATTHWCKTTCRKGTWIRTHGFSKNSSAVPHVAGSIFYGNFVIIIEHIFLYWAGRNIHTLSKPFFIFLLKAVTNLSKGNLFSFKSLKIFW